MRQTFIFSAALCSILFVSNIIRAQTIHFSYNYKIEMLNATEPPDLPSTPNINLPDAARKNGVEGTVKAEAILGADGKIGAVVITQDLPFGVGDAVKSGLQKLYFQPAKKNGKPTDSKLFLEYVVTATYDEGDKNVVQPKIIDKPAAVYPPSQKSSGVKGKVSVTAGFFTDGTIKVVGVSSTMPKEFDRAAEAAAKKISFQPATHKKSKKPVSQVMTVEYEFKP